MDCLVLSCLSSDTFLILVRNTSRFFSGKRHVTKKRGVSMDMCLYLDSPTVQAYDSIRYSLNSIFSCQIN